MAKLFLSYAREDRDLAAGLAKGLEASGHEVWWDRHLAGGTRFREVIETEIRKAEVMVVIWTAISIHKDFVCDEAERAKVRGRLIPVSFDVEPELPLGFGQLNYVDLSKCKGAPKAKDLGELNRAIATIGEGRYQEALATLTGRVNAGAAPKNEALRAVMELGSTVGGLPLQRYLGGVAAAAALGGVVQLLGVMFTSEDGPMTSVIGVAIFAGLAAAVARACAQFVLLSKGKSSRTFFDRRFSFWSLLAVLIAAILFAIAVNGDGAAWEMTAEAIAYSFGAIAGLFIARTLLALGNVLMSRIDAVETAPSES